MTDENINRGEDGRPMLRFDSMDNTKEQGSTMHTDNRPRGEGGEPMLGFSGSKDSDSFEISDRSKENQQRAVSELKKEFGPKYESAVKNAKAVLKYADEEYPKSLEQSGLGNYPPLIKALNKLGKELEKKYHKANRPGSMRKAMLNAFRQSTREKVNHLINDIESDYINRYGEISR